MKKRILYLVVLLIFLLVFAVIFFLVNANIQRIGASKINLQLIRYRVHEYKKIHGIYPKSIKALEDDKDVGISKAFIKEYISKSMYCENIFNVLNGNGGWYYNPDTGELKINLTNPVRHYLWFYFGEKRNEIPADW